MVLEGSGRKDRPATHPPSNIFSYLRQHLSSLDKSPTEATRLLTTSKLLKERVEQIVTLTLCSQHAIGKMSQRQMILTGQLQEEA